MGQLNKDKEDRRHMRHALALAERGLGLVSPNPAVGCVIVKKGKIIGRGATAPGGRPHAETIALAQAGRLAKGATVYVTLEPCAHHGQTGPCAQALVDAGVKRVVIATVDPDRRVSGRGIKILERDAIHVDVGCCEPEAKEMNDGFLKSTVTGMPHVALKFATSLDGKIATRSGHSQWITGPEARRHGHGQRARYDAILVGVGTVIADNPMLDCRLPGLEHQSPVRLVLDERLETPVDCKLVQGARQQRTIIVTAKSNSPKRLEMERLGVELFTVADSYNIENCLEKLVTDFGVTRLLVEGGAGVHSLFLKAGVVDRLYHYQAGKVIGADGLGVVSNLEIDDLGAVPYFDVRERIPLGNDTLVIYTK